MSETTFHTALQESVVDVLERMFFIGPLEEPLGEPESSSRSIAVHLDFDGDPPGSLTLRTTVAAARSIAADFLGEDGEVLSVQQVEEVLCELTNMICGAVLSRVESRAVFRLGVPQVLPADEAPTPLPGYSPDAGTAPTGATVRLAEIGGGALTVTVNTEGPACTVVERYAF
jgi:CheY-specific phosphatase CheX